MSDNKKQISYFLSPDRYEGTCFDQIQSRRVGQGTFSNVLYVVVVVLFSDRVDRYHTTFVETHAKKTMTE